MEEIPPQIQFQFNLTLPSGKPKLGESLETPFTLTVSTVPNVAQITIKGFIDTRASKQTLEKLMKDLEKKKPNPLPQIALQYLMFEVMLICRELGLPPPVPLSSPPITKESTMFT